MTSPLRITYRGIEHTDSIEDYVRKRADKLTRDGTGVTSCRVVIEAPHNHKVHGNHYLVRIEVSAGAGDFVVDRAPDAGRETEDLYASIDAAFDHAVRRLHDETGRLEAKHRGGRAEP